MKTDWNAPLIQLRGRLLRGILGCLYPQKCALCGTIGLPTICDQCHSELTRHEFNLTSYGGHDELDWSISLFDYVHRAAQAVRRLKFDRATSLSLPMAAEITDASIQPALPRIDCWIPVPIHWRRRCFRGFNQSELLAEGLPSELVRPSWLVRVRATRPQVGLSRDERLVNLRGAFRCTSEVAGKRIALLDDVMTSGGTAKECARTLKQGGALEVGILTFCGPAGGLDQETYSREETFPG